MKTKPVYVVMISTGAGPVRHDGPYDKYRDAIDERNWIFGHGIGIQTAWLEKDGKISGAVLRR